DCRAGIAIALRVRCGGGLVRRLPGPLRLAAISQLTHDWLHAQVTRQAMMITAALCSGRACGFIAVSVMPASLALGTAWSIRDLYVAPAHRRMGIAGVLLQQVIDDAREAGAHRVAFETETGNTPALTLYAAAGFQPVTGLELLSVDLAHDRQEPRGTL